MMRRRSRRDASARYLSRAIEDLVPGFLADVEREIDRRVFGGERDGQSAHGSTCGSSSSGVRPAGPAAQPPAGRDPGLPGLLGIAMLLTGGFLLVLRLAGLL